MTPREALTAAQTYLSLFRYVPDLGEYFETLKEVEQGLGADCDGFAVGAIQRAYSLADTPKPKFRLVIGSVSPGATTGKHAWVEWDDEQGQAQYLDPTPGYTPGVIPATWWSRTPEYSWEYDGIGFTDAAQYEPKEKP